METLDEYDECYKQAAEDEYRQHMTQSLVFRYNQSIYRSGDVAYRKTSLRPLKRMCDVETLDVYLRELSECDVDFIFEYFYERVKGKKVNNSLYFVTLAGGREDRDTGFTEEIDYFFVPYDPSKHDEFALNRKKQK